MRCPLTLARSLRSTGQYLLEVRWRGDVAEEAFTIKCRTEELLRQWQKAINKAVEEAPSRRRAHHLSSSRRSERSVHSPASQFPPTPMSEYGPTVGGGGYGGAGYEGGHYSAHSSHHSQYYNLAQPSYPPGHGTLGTPHFGFDDDADEQRHYEPSESGRSTPATGRRRPPDATRSLPPDHPHMHPSQQRDLPGLPRPRAQTEDSSSHVISQWRTQPPPHPPQRGASQSSDAPSLRSSASSKQLRTKPSSEWGGPTGGFGSVTSSPAASYARLPPDETTPRAQPHSGAASSSTAGVHRHASHGQVQAAPQAPGMLRNRSASSPNIYGPADGRFADSPQMPSGEEWHEAQARAHAQQQLAMQQQQQQQQPVARNRATGGTSSGGTLASATTMASSAGGGARNGKRFSSSSYGTDRSSATSAHDSRAGGYGASSVPALPAGSSGASSPVVLSNSGHASATAVRVKVFFGDDAFVVVVLDTVPYPDLVDKVLKKIRMCGGDRARVDGQSLRLRYRDEDGDRILITSEEDVTMAFETARVMCGERGPGAPLELVLDAAVDQQ